jgi:hypothetical protein
VSDNPRTRATPANLTPPRTIDYACIATLVQAVAWLGAAITLRFNTDAFLALLFKNSKQKDGTKYDPASAADRAHLLQSLNDSRRGLLVQGLILFGAFTLLAFMLRRTRGAAAARWSIVIVSVLTQAPLYIMSIGGGLPTITGVVNFLLGVSSITAIVMLFLPASRKYFRDVREEIAATMPPRQARSGGLFGPRRTATRPTTQPDSRVVDSTPAEVSDEVAPKGPSLDKKHADAAAVAKGAALARNRAKAASKSRRSED